jgi:hypothetical protein
MRRVKRCGDCEHLTKFGTGIDNSFIWSCKKWIDEVDDYVFIIRRTDDAICSNFKQDKEPTALANSGLKDKVDINTAIKAVQDKNFATLKASIVGADYDADKIIEILGERNVWRNDKADVRKEQKATSFKRKLKEIKKMSSDLADHSNAYFGYIGELMESMMLYYDSRLSKIEKVVFTDKDDDIDADPDDGWDYNCTDSRIVDYTGVKRR